jgi:tetratricopeptide (TPR) repeat protein
MPNSVSASRMAPDDDAVADELERLASSNCFRKAERCLRLLRHLTNVTLEGRSGELKEYALGVTVLERPESFDPRIDPMVRLEARRLRLKLAEYYQEEGLTDRVVINLPKGAYVPKFRFRSVPEVPAPGIMDPAPAPPPVAPPKHRAVFVWPAIGMILVLIAVAGWYGFRKIRPGLPLRASIAVLGFRDLSPQQRDSWISAAVSELMNIDLGAEQRLRTLPLENVARMRTELSLTQQTSYPVQLLQRIHADLGSDYVVTGSYLQQDHRIRLDVVLFDVRSGQQVAAIRDESAEDNLPELASRCAGRVRAQLGVRLPASGQPFLQAGGLEQYRQGMEQYARGMERLRQGDALGARAYLEKAVAADPSHSLFHSGLAAVLSALGLDTQAGQEAKRALDSSSDLGRVEQLEIEGRYRNIAHDWPRAIQVYQALFTLLPDDLEYGLLLGSAEVRGGQAQEALRTVKTLRGLPAPLGDDPRIDLTEAQAAGALSDFAHTQSAARSAAEKASARGARLLYAKARLLQSGAMQNINMVGFEDVRAEARRICAELGDRLCVAAAYRIEANQVAGMGEVAVAQRLYQAALEIANQSGNAIEKLNALNGLANAAKLRGDLPVAEGYYRSALTIASDLGPQKSISVCLGLADILADSGSISEAQSLIEQALRIARQTGEREGAGLGEAALAHTLELEGKTQAALDEYNQALAILREVNEPYELSEALLDLGNTQLDQADLAGARKSFEEARTLGRSFPGGVSLPETELAFAHLSFAEGHFADAASHARLALSGFTASGRESDRYQAAAILAGAFMSNGRTAEASALLAQFPPPYPAKFSARSVVQFEIAQCFLLAHTGRRGEAMRAIDAVIATAVRRGIRSLERDALEAKKGIEKTAANKGA